MEGEHFGIAVAEMARAGCLPLVHASGGPVEIVDAEPALLWTTPADAAVRLRALLDAPACAEALAAALTRRAARFAPETFVARVRESVAQL